MAHRITKYLFLLVSLIFITIDVMGQENISQLMNRDLFRLYEVSADQEGLFYTPPQLNSGLISNSKSLNERRLASAEKNENLKVIANTSFNLGTIALQEEDRTAARKHFLRAASASEESGDEKFQATMLMYLGLVNYQEQLFDEALTNFNDAANLLLKNGQSGAAAYSYLMTGQTFLAAKNFNRAYLFFRKAHDILTFPDQKSRIGVQLAEIAIRLHKYTDAENFLSTSLAAFQRNGLLSGQAMVYRDRGIMLMKRNEFEKAVAEFDRSLRLSSQISTSKLIKDTYLKMFTLASLQGDHNKSNQINIIYEQLRDSIDNVEKGRVVSSRFRQRELLERDAIEEMLRKQKDLPYSQLSQKELERNKELTEMELERLEKEKIIEDLNTAKKMSDQANVEREEQIRLLQAQKAEQDLALSRKELEISRQATLRNTLVIGFISLIIVAALLYNRYRSQKKSHLALDKAYTELSETHQKLLETQEQLVHAQKMASLGQLTAGIAHEIQNPLNFVNNFAELSNEILNEMKEPGADREALLNELSSNLEKIHNHGKRADKIVKGMLLHSRSGPAEKQLVNINTVIDELIELSYHGSRTKNSGFSAEIVKRFDLSLPEVPVIVNDLSRVLVNLFNNSFYALGEKAKTSGRSFQPVLEVTTSNLNNSIEIAIRDNGTGIPQSVISKIYDPFFTTKPAGQGTGLGLSLSYDIITKGHSGTMTVSSEEGQFTEFKITLPTN